MVRPVPAETESRCHTQQLLDSLPDEAAAAVTRALLAGNVTTAQVVAVLTDHGLPARTENVNRHRRRLKGGTYACKCPLPVKVTTG